MTTTKQKKMEQQSKILLIYNRFTWKPVTLLSFIIRVLTYGPNHAAEKRGNEVHEMVGSDLWWTIKKLVGLPVSYEPNKGCGYKVTPWEEWISSTPRIVRVYKPMVELKAVDVKEGYGFLDLIQFFLYIIRRKWLLIGNDWNGKDGVRIWSGLFCSELMGKRVGRKDAHLLAPADLQHIPELKFEYEFETGGGKICREI